jgi:uncharacterized protein
LAGQSASNEGALNMNNFYPKYRVIQQLRRRACVCTLFCASWLATVPVVLAQQPLPLERRAELRPALTVQGEAEVWVRPDRASIQLGAEAQAAEAAVAQENVSRIVERAVKRIRDAGVPEEAIQTSGLQLFPVYSRPAPRPDREVGGETVVGYRASNILRIRVDNISLIGDVVDAGMAAGANRVHGISFGLKDELPHRTKALQLAVREAQAKAEAIAQALGQPLGPIRHVAEEAAPGMPRPFAMERAMAVATPVQPGEMQVQASVTVVFDLVSKPGESGGEGKGR